MATRKVIKDGDEECGILDSIVRSSKAEERQKAMGNGRDSTD